MSKIPENDTYATSTQTNDIYLDYQASTPCDIQVQQAMTQILARPGNPHARSHKFGWDANTILDDSRAAVAEAIGALADDIIFTSGATESNNLAIKGLTGFWEESDKKHILTIKTEHKCLLEALATVSRQGYTVEYLDVDEQGLVDPAMLEKHIRPETLCIAISAVNHEIGTIQPLASIGAIARKHKVFLHIDAAQALGKIPIDVNLWNADTLSLSAHKTYGPQGVGALYVRTKPRRMRLKPLSDGGGQERGMRSGTVPVFLAAGMATACKLFANPDFIAAEHARISQLHHRFYDALQALTHIYLNGPQLIKNLPMSDQKRIPHNLNISIAGVEGESLMMTMPHIAYSSGSACTSADLRPSYVLQAIGVTGPKEDLLHSSVRISFGKDTTTDQVDRTIVAFQDAIIRLRSISPVWEDIEKYGAKY